MNKKYNHIKKSEFEKEIEYHRIEFINSNLKNKILYQNHSE